MADPMNVLCLHQAGGSPAAFAALSRALRDAPVQLHPMRYPDVSVGEWTVQGIAGALLDGCLPLARPPYVWLGYSMGALVAFELARRMRAAQRPSARALCAVSRAAPHCPSRRASTLGLDDAAFVAAVEQHYGPIPAQVKAEPEIMAMLLPQLKGQLWAYDRYELAPDARLDTPIHVFTGTQDALIASTDAEAWGEHTDGAVEHHPVEAGHFLLAESHGSVAAALRELAY